jgi:hypothetical protein
MQKYLASYDHHNKYLSLDLDSGQSKVETLSQPPSKTTKLRGLFVTELEVLVGKYASGKGPVVFFNDQFYLCEFGKASAESRARSTNQRHFVFRLNGKEIFSLDYNPRGGVGANPYDQELSDIDLFALIEKNLATPRFFENYVDSQVPSPNTPMDKTIP